MSDFIGIVLILLWAAFMGAIFHETALIEQCHDTGIMQPWGDYEAVIKCGFEDE